MFYIATQTKRDKYGHEHSSEEMAFVQLAIDKEGLRFGSPISISASAIDDNHIYVTLNHQLNIHVYEDKIVICKMVDGAEDFEIGL